MAKAITSSSSTTIQAAAGLIDLLFPAPRSFNVRLWDGTLLQGNEQFGPTMVIRHPGSLRRMFSPPFELALGEAYIHGDFDIEGDLVKALESGVKLVTRTFTFSQVVQIGRLLLSLPTDQAPHRVGRSEAQLKGNIHSQDRDRAAIQYHYDVGNDFFALWLGKRLVYSCAYFKTGAEDLDTAQEDKLDHICRKLHLKPGDRLLDVGCGWGGLIQYACEHYGVKALGITLSQEQFRLANELIAASHLDGQAAVELRDYRQLQSEQFDKIASIGMFEHVGRKRMAEYFSQCYRLLKPGGIFLNHAISCQPEPQTTVWQRFIARNIIGLGSFDHRYFFPDGELMPVSATNLAAEQAGFEVRDVENLREHYALTLQHWLKNMEASRSELIQVTNEVTYRTWRLYMAFVSIGFIQGQIGINQSLLSKSQDGRCYLPNTREDLYR